MQIEPMRKGACILVLVESRRARVGLCWLFLLALVLPGYLYGQPANVRFMVKTRILIIDDEDPS